MAANGVGSSRPSAISRISFGVVKVSTSPVVIVTSRIQSRSRWSVAARLNADVRDPASGPDELGAELKRLGAPTASMATSAPSLFRGAHDRCNWVDGAVVDRHVRAEVPSLLEPRLCDVEDDDPP